MLRLLYVSHSLPPEGRPLANVGGMQRVSSELYGALRRHADVELSEFLLRASWRWTHVRVVPFGARLLTRLPARVDADAIEAVLFSSMVTAAMALPLRPALARRGVVVGAIPIGRDVTLPFAPYQALVPRVLRSMDALFPISRATAEECLARGASADRLQVIPCGVDVGRFPLPEDRRSARRTLLEALDLGTGVTDDDLLLFGLGRHVERKGFVWFVEQVMPRLPENVRFWLAGEGPRTPVIRAAVERLGLAGRVRLLGTVSEEALGLLLRGTDLFVMPNVRVPGDIEGFGVVMLEAGLSGLPVVAAGIEGILDVVREGENGHLVASRDAAAFAARITRYERDRAALAAASRRAHDHTAATFGWPAIAGRFVRALGGLVEERRRWPAAPPPARTRAGEPLPQLEETR